MSAEETPLESYLSVNTSLTESEDPSQKLIYINYLVTGQKNIPLLVKLNWKVKDLKKEIENLLKIKLVNKLMIKPAKRRNQRSLDDEDITLESAHIHNYDIITIGRNEVKGGISKKNKFKSRLK